MLYTNPRGSTSYGEAFAEAGDQPAQLRVETHEDVILTRYRFSGMPWDSPEEYAKRSPITYVGNVTTPTMLVTGELDYRTPSSEAEQLYQALTLRMVPTAMVRFPDAPHDNSAKPSNMMAKVAYVAAWLDRYRGEAGRAVP